MLNGVNPRRSLLLYTLIRVGLFALALVLLLWLLPSWVPQWLSAVLAAIIAMSLSFIFLRKPREEVAKNLYEVRHRAPVVHEDEALEDTVVDRDADRPQPPATPAG
jgi:hypothetical protein